MKKSRYKILGILALVFVFLMSLTGCENKAPESDFQIFYMNESKTGMVPRAYELEASDTDGRIQEIIEQFQTDSKDVEYGRLFPKEVMIERYEYSDTMLKLYFNKAYGDMDPVMEVLCRGGIVRTLLQLEEISGVSFYVNDIALKDANNEVVGVMTKDTFVDNPGEEIQNIQETEVTLYFASADGQGLVKETQKVYYSSNISIEKLVVERLMNGPESANARGTIPEGTQLINVSVMNGICLVNFSDGFLVHNFKISEPVVIYSIVDSLTELPTVNTVQITVNGDSDRVYREKYDLSVQYERDLSLVTEENDDVKVISQGEKKEAR